MRFWQTEEMFERGDPKVNCKRITNAQGNVRTYNWCPKHKFWVTHKPENCKYNPNKAKPEETSKKPKVVSQGDTLKLAKALAANN